MVIPFCATIASTLSPLPTYSYAEHSATIPGMMGTGIEAAGTTVPVEAWTGGVKVYQGVLTLIY